MNYVCDRNCRTILRISACTLLAALALLAHRGVAGITSRHAVTVVVTYHYDNFRSGWNPQESQLNYSNVNHSSLGVQTVHLDDENDQVDAQPLIALNVQIAGGRHNVVYVATEANNIYALDADTGAKLKMQNLGPPVKNWCPYNGPVLGINGTPAMDLPSSTMYVITYNTDSSNNPAYFIHALDLATLTDKVPPRPIAASHRLSDGTTFSFNAAWQYQSSGLLLSNGTVYAGFGALCDVGGDQARGWILGWKASSLIPLPVNFLTNTFPSKPNASFLSSVWMSGYGIAGDQNGNIYFSTCSSDPSGVTYNADANVSNSVVRLNPDLTRPSPTSKHLFTPANVSALDQSGSDVGAGGVMLLPTQSGPVSKMVVATANDGRMFLLDRDNLGGFNTDSGALSEVRIGSRCWCGPTYFNDGSPHLVSSGGVSGEQALGPNRHASANAIGLWDLQTSPTPKLIQTALGAMPDTIQDPGFFTTVSSNGKNSAIIWAVSRPQANSRNPYIWLYAFKATPSGNTLPVLFQSVAGIWSYVQGNANIVPVVANGKVYVASYRELDVFGLNLPGAQMEKAGAKALAQVPGPQFVKGPEEHQLSGVVLKIDGSHLTIETRGNKTVEVDATEAERLFRYSAVIRVGDSVIAAGSYDANSVLHAIFVLRAKPSPETWPPDR